MSTLSRFRMVAVPLVALAAIAMQGQSASFPGSRSELWSRNGRYVVRDTHQEGIPVPEPAHALILVDRKTGTTTTLHRYLRHVDVLFSPVLDAIAINDYEGSDLCKAFLYALPRTGARIDLMNALADFLVATKDDRVLDNGHVYLAVRRWVNGRELLCRLEAYGEVSPRGLTRYYIYKIGGGFRVYRPGGATKH